LDEVADPSLSHRGRLSFYVYAKREMGFDSWSRNQNLLVTGRASHVMGLHACVVVIM
jgi:hypothetical protein